MKHGMIAAAVLVMATTLAWAEGDGKGQAGAGAGHRGWGMGNVDEHFAQMDKNGNGVIDKDEFHGPTNVFARIDTDNSGTLSKDELKAFRAQRRTHEGAAAQTNAQPAAACEPKAK